MQIRRFLAPKWLVGHLLVLAAAVTMVFLGRWQLHVSESKHFSLQNFGYALQWWAFSGFAIVMWLRILRDVVQHETTPGEAAQSTTEQSTTDQSAAGQLAAGQPAYRSYQMPQSSAAPAPAGDPMHAAYNDYLARLNSSAKKEVDL